MKNQKLEKIESDNRYMFGKHISLIGSTMGARSDFAQVMGLILDGDTRHRSRFSIG
jgi:hypothetical protein